jgi:hypothetical protein
MAGENANILGYLLRIATATESLDAGDGAGGATAAQIGEVQANPTANTVLDRLKAIATALASVPVVGSVAHDGVDAGAPIKIGGYAAASAAAPAVVAPADRVNAWFSRNGAQVVALGTQNVVGTASPANVVYPVSDNGGFYPLGVAAVGHSFAHIATSTTTTVKSGAGILHTLTVNNLGTVASTTTIYDNTAGSGTVIAIINTLAGQTSYVYDVVFATGLTIVTTGTVAPDITVSYR